MLPRWVAVLQLPRGSGFGVGSHGVGVCPLQLLRERDGESFAPSLLMSGLPARNPHGIVEGGGVGWAQLLFGEVTRCTAKPSTSRAHQKELNSGEET